MERNEIPVPAELLDAIGRRTTWSDAVRVGSHIFCTGQVGWDKKTGTMENGIEAQTARALQNLSDVLARAGATLRDVVLIQVYILDRADHDLYDGVYQEFFPESPPARVTVVVSDLVDEGSRIDIAAIAALA